MVRRLHDAGIEVILDVVYNHTAEGDQTGPTLSFRGIDNASYYRLLSDSPRYYIKHFTTVAGTEGSLNMSGYGDNKGTGDVTIFRITARGTGASSDSAEVILRTQYGRIF